MRPSHRLLLGFAVWIVVVAGAITLVAFMARPDDRAYPQAPPLYGVVDVVLSPRVLLAAVLAAFLIGFGPWVATQLRWAYLLALSFVVSAVWALRLAFVRGGRVITDPLIHPTEFLASVPLIDAPGPFLRTFAERLSDYTIHVQGHPPGVPLFGWWLERIGLARPGVLAAIIVAVGSSAAPATLIAIREVAGAVVARCAAPFLILAPAAIWVATSVDALYLGLGAWCVALAVVATGRRGSRSVMAAVGSGLFGAAALFASYGTAGLGLIVLAVAAARRRVLPIVVGGAVILVVGLVFAAFGFSWIEGLRATSERYEAGISSIRPYAPFLLVNLAAFAVATGPVAAGAVASLRDRRLWLLTGGALAAVAIANLTGLSKGEVERIWLLFTPWVIAATGDLKHEWSRSLLAVQATFGLVVAAVVQTKW